MHAAKILHLCCPLRGAATASALAVAALDLPCGSGEPRCGEAVNGELFGLYFMRICGDGSSGLCRSTRECQSPPIPPFQTVRPLIPPFSRTVRL